MNEHETAGNLMNLLKAGLTPFVEKELKTAYGQDWTKYTKATGQNGAMHWDISSLVETVIEQWNPLFGKQLTPSVKSLFYEIREWRNKWAHQQPITADDLYRISDSAERLLLAISSPDAEKINKFKSEILRAISENEAQRMQEQAEAEERKRREQVARRERLAVLLPRLLASEEGEIIHAMQAVLNTQEGLRDITPDDIAAYFQDRQFNSNAGVRAEKSQGGHHSPSPAATLIGKGSVENLGQKYVEEALHQAGLKTTLVQRGMLEAYTDSHSGKSPVCRIRVISASKCSFSINLKFSEEPHTRLAYVWNIGNISELQIYILTYDEALHLAERKKWTNTDSWLVEGNYYTTKPDKILRQYLQPYKMTPEKWRQLFGG